MDQADFDKLNKLALDVNDNIEPDDLQSEHEVPPEPKKQRGRPRKSKTQLIEEVKEFVKPQICKTARCKNVCDNDECHVYCEKCRDKYNRLEQERQEKLRLKREKLEQQENNRRRKIGEYTDELREAGQLKDLDEKCDSCNKTFIDKDVITITFCISGGRLSAKQGFVCSQCSS